MTIIEAMNDKKLFARWFADGTSWARWRVFLAALFGLPMSEADLEIFAHHTGRTKAPTQAAREAWVPVGRRGGKSRIAALLAVYLAVFREVTRYLAPGEWGTLPIIAADRKQARTVFRYVTAFFEQVPMLQKLITRKGVDFLELKNRVVIEIHTASYKSTRGYTCVGVICDEISFWPADEFSANPDKEIIAGLRPGMATVPGSLLIAISSPYGRRGMLWENYDRHFGQDDDEIFVWTGSSLEMNPSLNRRVIEQAMIEDEASARAEYFGEFRRDIEAFVSREVVERAVIPGRMELPFFNGPEYFGFVDPSGGSQDSFTLAIAHQEQERLVLDLVREQRPPFSPEETVRNFCATLRNYRISTVVGDRYAGAWVSEPFQKHGVTYQVSEKTKSDLYTDFLPLLNSARVELLDHPRLKMQLLALERKTARGGKGSIDHPPRHHDDLINSVAGAMATLSTEVFQPVGFVRLLGI